jgi:hypothetical protein
MRSYHQRGARTRPQYICRAINGDSGPERARVIRPPAPGSLWPATGDARGSPSASRWPWSATEPAWAPPSSWATGPPRSRSVRPGCTRTCRPGSAQAWLSRPLAPAPAWLSCRSAPAPAWLSRPSGWAPAQASRLLAPARAWPGREPKSAPPPARPRPGSPSASLGHSPWPPPSASPSARRLPRSRLPHHAAFRSPRARPAGLAPCSRSSPGRTPRNRSRTPSPSTPPGPGPPRSRAPSPLPPAPSCCVTAPACSSR